MENKSEIKGIEKLVFLFPYIIAFVMLAILNLEILEKRGIDINVLQEVFESKAKFYTVLVLITIVFCIAVFLVQYIITKLVLKFFCNTEKFDDLAISLLLTETLVITASLFLTKFIGFGILLALINMVFGIGMFLFLLYPKYSQKELTIAVAIKSIFYIINIILVMVNNQL